MTNPFLAPSLPPTSAVVGADGRRRHHGCVYAAVPGWRSVELDLRVPAGPGPVPVVVWIHGGAWMAGNRHLLPPALRPDQLFDALLDAGLAVASIEYRHAREAPFPAQLHDAQAAVRWLRHHAADLGLDPDRVGVGGESAGGHLAALVALCGDRPDLQGTTGVQGPSSAVTTLVDWYGIADVEAMPEHTGPPPEVAAQLPPEALVPPLEVLLAGVDDATRATASPVTLVGPGAPSALLVHGTADTTVPHDQSVRLHTALLAVGVRSELLSVPGAGHGFDGADAVDAVDAVVARTVEHLRRELTG